MELEAARLIVLCVRMVDEWQNVRGGGLEARGQQRVCG